MYIRLDMKKKNSAFSEPYTGTETLYTYICIYESLVHMYNRRT